MKKLLSLVFLLCACDPYDEGYILRSRPDACVLECVGGYLVNLSIRETPDPATVADIIEFCESTITFCCERNLGTYWRPTACPESVIRKANPAKVNK